MKRKRKQEAENEPEILRVALVGAANCGKTTLFNALTGAREHTGNWSGVTVEKQEKRVRYRGYEIEFWDLPGTTSMEPQSEDERVTCQALQESDVILQVMELSTARDALPMTLELLQKTTGWVIPVLHVMDSKLTVDSEEMGGYCGSIIRELSGMGSFYTVSGLLGDVWVNAKTKEGLTRLWEQLILAASGRKPQRNLRLPASKVPDLLQRIQEGFPASLKEIPKPKNSALDTVLLHPFLGYVCWSSIMVAVFLLTFGVGGFLQSYVDCFMRNLGVLIGGLLHLFGVSPGLVSLIQDGILSGVGTVVSFFPSLCILFVAMSILEESGYMARMALLGDGVCRKLGICGRALFPLLLGWGCTVPAVYATRILPTPEQRKRTICLLPMFSCSAKLPIYVMLCEIFFPEYAAWITLGLYVLGLLLAVLAAGIIKFLRPQEKNILPVTLPRWQRPTLKYTGQYVGERLHTYVLRVGSTVVFCSIFLWYLLHFNAHGMCLPEESFGMYVGKALAVPMQWIGISQWQWCLALLCGALSKELVVASLGILYSGGGVPLSAALLASGLSPICAVSLLVFCLLYSPCFAAVSSVYQETKSLRFTMIFALAPLVLAYVICLFLYQISRILMLLPI